MDKNKRPDYVKTCSKCHKIFCTKFYEDRLCSKCYTESAKSAKRIYSKW